MPSLLDLIDADEVRAALDVSLNPRALPDDAIDRAVFAGRAVYEISRRDSHAADREGEERERLALALNLLTASLIAPAVPSIVQESFGDGSNYKRQEIDWLKRAATLRQQSDEEMALLLNSNNPTTARASLMPPFFALARGGRGKW